MHQKNLSIIVILFTIIFLSAFLRIYDVDKIPLGLYNDEAANGYEAYSLLNTGNDLHGNSFPLYFNHHNIDYVEPMYTYLSVPLVFLFGLNTFSTRLLAVLIGTLTIFTTFLFARELFDKKIALISAALVAISPWHLVFSRIGFRGILAPLFITLALFFMIKSTKKTVYLIPSALILGLSIYTYSIMKLATPLIIIAFAVYYYFTIEKSQQMNKRTLIHLVISAVTFLVLVTPTYFFSFFREGNQRFNDISIFSAQNPIASFFQNFFSHFSLDFIFFNGDSNLRHSIPGFGQVLLILLPFIIFALFITIKKPKKEIFFVFSLFIIGLIPASLTNEGIPHALRAIPSVIFLEIIGAYGLFMFYNYLCKKEKPVRIIASSIVAALIVLNTGLFLSSYYGEYSSISEDWFQQEVKDSIIYAETNFQDYNFIVLTGSINQPYIFPLFFAKLDPYVYQENKSMGKYSICYNDINECYKEKEENTIFLVLPEELPQVISAKNIYNSKNQIVLRFVE